MVQMSLTICWILEILNLFIVILTIFTILNSLTCDFSQENQRRALIIYILYIHLVFNLLMMATTILGNGKNRSYGPSCLY